MLEIRKNRFDFRERKELALATVKVRIAERHARERARVFFNDVGARTPEEEKKSSRRTP